MREETVVIAGRIPRKHVPALNRYLKAKKMDKATLIERAVLSLILQDKEPELLQIKGEVKA